MDENTDSLKPASEFIETFSTANKICKSDTSENSSNSNIEIVQNKNENTTSPKEQVVKYNQSDGILESVNPSLQLENTEMGFGPLENINGIKMSNDESSLIESYKHFGNDELQTEENATSNNYLNLKIGEPFTIDINNPPTEKLTEQADESYIEKIDIHEKLKEMGEISVKPVSKNESYSLKRKIDESEISVEIKKKLSEKFDLEDSKKITNLRKNIREVMDENQLDATTLAAQRQESERLARVQEQQKIIRDLQRQMATERQNNRTQNRVLSLLQGQTSIYKNSTNNERASVAGSSTDMYIVKGIASEVTFKGSGFVDVDKISSGNLTPSVSIAPVRRTKSIENYSESDSEKKEVVTIIDSSSEDDCIVLSDDDEDLEPETEDDPHNSGLHVNDAYNIADENGRVVINIGHPEGEPNIYVAPQIARVIKPHQIGGVRFLFDNVIESVERFSTSAGFGCILAHSMGLGKTLQVVCFCDIFLRHTNSKSVLCIMPINTLQNWVSEFNMWLPENTEQSPLKSLGDIRPRNFKLFVLNDQQKTLGARSKVILEWAKVGGVLLIGYELYRLISLKMSNKKKKGKKGVFENVKHETESHKRIMEEIHAALVKPGPDLVICDEGHRIKNSHASISIALKQIRSKRRIVLTGYPLQNNLLEYWCMVDFVRPNYLGTKTEFSNMFERPIQNGQCIDSTPQDIKLMRYRAHVLHSLLVGFVQRRSHAVLQNALPQKQEYVILVRMTSFQRKLYDVFMNEVVRTKAVPNPLKAFAVCCKIWNHPDVLYNFLKKREADLDLELEEVENESNLPGKNKGTPSKAKEIINKNSETTPAIEIIPKEEITISTDTSNIKELQPQTQPCKVESTSFQESMSILPPKLSLPPNSIQYDSGYSNYNLYNYDNFCTPLSNLYQQMQGPNNNFDSTYTTNAKNNFWNGSPNFYGFDGQTSPNYIGIMSKSTKSFDQSKQPSSGINSSEIVDLDTKEIKTVETNIGTLEIQNLKTPSTEIKADNHEEIVSVKDEKEPFKITKEDGIQYDWAVEIMKGYVPDLLETSPKMVIFFRLLDESVKLGDRILVFSQSLLTLNLIERFLQKYKVHGCDYCWAKNTTYFRLDGSTTALEREKLINEFNANPKVHLFLVSTRAGSLGINLVGANRVIVFDASWNPCHDTQAVCRVYRYGQKKPCFVYRMVMDNCLEKKIYDRQVNKQGMSDRVVDECNPDAHLSMKEVTNLCYDNDTDTEIKDLSSCKDKYVDLVMQKIVEMYSDLLSKEPFQHESLLVDRKEKKLSQAEKRLAQRGYEMEKRAAAKPTYVYHSVGTQYKVMRTPDGAIVHRPVASVRPMQMDLADKLQGTRPGGVRPTRWIPAEVWQRQGMTAQEMTLPLDVVIPTSSGEKANIVLKAGQKVMVLKSPKGIYMQLETGKIIAIRTSFKVGQTKEKVDDNGDISSNAMNLEDSLKKSGIQTDSFTESLQASNLDALNNIQKDSKIKNSTNFTVEKQLFKSKDKFNDIQTNRSMKLQTNSLHRRNFQPNCASVAKSFNVQDLIDSKMVIPQQQIRMPKNPKAKSNHCNIDNIINIQENSGQMNKRNLHNFPKTKFRKDYSDSLEQKVSPHTVTVKPQMQNESDNWDLQTLQNNFSHTITIEDDYEPSQREKITYKPNLIERKHKLQTRTEQRFQSNQHLNSKTEQLNINHHRTVNKKLQDEHQLHDHLKQLQNVKPYNKQCHPDQNPQSNSQKDKSDFLTSIKQQQKLPSIKNIPAPYPSICAVEGVGTTTITSKNSGNYFPISKLSSSASESTVSQKIQNSPATQSATQFQMSSQSARTEKDDRESTTERKYSENSSSPNPNSTDSFAKGKTPTIDEHYLQRNHQITSAQYGTSANNPNYSNYTPPEHGGFQHYPNMYGTTNPHPYNYPSSTQHPYPYNSYHNPYEPALYQSSQSSSPSTYNAAALSSNTSNPSGQYYYPSYTSMSPPMASNPLTDQYNSYLPPYPPHQTTQWQQ